MNKIICFDSCNTPLNHSGVPDQKHGVRRYQYPDGTRTPLGKLREKLMRKKNKAENKSEIQPSDDYAQSKEDRAKATKGLSNSELKRLNERLQLEKTYKELSEAEKKKGESFAKGILKDITKGALTESGKKLLTNILNTVVTEPLTKNITEYMKKKE